MTPRLRLLGLLVVFVFLAVSGTGHREPEDLAYIVALGLDPGTKNLLTVTVTIAIPRAFALGPAGGAEVQKTFVNTTAVAPSLLDALDIMNSYIGRQLSLLHVQVVVFGSSLARKGLARHVLEALAREREIRQNIFILVARDTAKSFLEANKPTLEQNPAKYFEMMTSGGQGGGRTLPMMLYRFTGGIKNGGEAPIAQLVGVTSPKAVPVPGEEDRQAGFSLPAQDLAEDTLRQGGNKVVFLGTALFDADKMVGTLDGLETLFLTILRGKLAMVFYSVRDPKEPRLGITLRISQPHGPDIRMHHRGRAVALRVRCRIEAELVTVPSGINYERPARTRALEDYLSRHFTRRARALVAKLQRLGVDSAGFGAAARRSFLTETAWKSFDWPARFAVIPIETEMRLYVRRTGLLLKTYPPSKN